MIKQGVKNYFAGLKHFFTPVGTLFLGIVLGLSVFPSGLHAAIRKVIDDVNALSGDISLDFESLAASLVQAVRALNWREPTQALQTLLSKEWQNTALTDCLNSLLGVNYETYIDSITKIVREFVNGLAALGIVFMLCTLLGLVSGYWLTRFLVRRTIAKRVWWKYFLVSALDSLLSATMVVLCALFIGLWAPSVFIAVLVAILLMGAASLVEAYFVHAFRKLPFRQILNPKNILSLIAANIIVFVIAVAVTVFAVTVVNAFVGVIIGLALLEIAMLTASMNAESYVINTVAKQTAAKKSVETQTVASDSQ